MFSLLLSNTKTSYNPNPNPKPLSLGADLLSFTGYVSSGKPQLRVSGKAFSMAGSMNVSGSLKNGALQSLGVAGSVRMGTVELNADIIYCPQCKGENAISVMARVSDNNGPVTLIDLLEAVDINTDFLGPAKEVVNGIGLDSPTFLFENGHMEITSAVEIAGFNDMPFTIVFAANGTVKIACLV